MNGLIQKYNVPGPRYTSYPTVPHWNSNGFSLREWKHSIKTAFDALPSKEGVSLYIHLPFCESLCTFCGCHKRITRRHEVEDPYIEAVLKEWKLYVEILKRRPVIDEIHLGGGTPTFFKPTALRRLIEGLFAYAQTSAGAKYSFEGHPSNTTREHLATLFDLGFTRVSFGIQDYDSKVQQAIHRIQSFEQVNQVSSLAREIGYSSIGHDLIYGLPLQTVDSIRHTLEQTLRIRPDRIALYSYAHVPWMKGNGQRGYSESELPSAEEKQQQYELAKTELLRGGYIDIGMDHFALETDDLAKASKNNTLHRNFMGYTTKPSKLMIGLGMSAISDSWGAFAQNEKNLEGYQALVEEGILPVFRGHILSEQDLIIRTHILELMTRLETHWDSLNPFEGFHKTMQDLAELEKDRIVELWEHGVRITSLGKPFVRNVAMCFDQHLQNSKSNTPRFSMTI